ncbi:MAG: helix-turn-helix transcriptional regulator [Microcella pacifica]|jgi:transcriptional regulator with XRE-family HTH domain|uniref:helix-turn-helix domain-containing protein n=1 Tax=Microcella pacifica TaxID=2591847 RepID=UPI003314C32B
MVLVRQEIGEVLRDVRLQKGRTLRQVASRASVALGYLSEVERGQKEASSEILASVADALDTPISIIMREVGDRLAVIEGVDITSVDINSVDIDSVTVVPDTLPDELVAEFDADFAMH